MHASATSSRRRGSGPRCRTITDARASSAASSRIRPVSLDELEAHEQLFAETPLLRSIELPDVQLYQEGVALPDWDPIGAQVTRAFENLPAGRITHVNATPLVRDEFLDPVLSKGNELLAALSSTAAGRLLRGLHLQEPAELESLAPFEALEDLTLPRSFPLSRLPELPLPKLRHLAFYGDGFVRGEPLRAFLGSPLAARLTTLDLSLNYLLDDDAIAIASAPSLAGLTSLGLDGASLGRRGVEAIASSPHLSGLRTLDLGELALTHLDVLVTATFAPGLRELRLVDSFARSTAVAHVRALPGPRAPRPPLGLRHQWLVPTARGRDSLRGALMVDPLLQAILGKPDNEVRSSRGRDGCSMSPRWSGRSNRR